MGIKKKKKKKKKSGEATLSKWLLPFWKVVYSKRKELDPNGKFFPYRAEPFSEGAWLQESKQEVTKIVSFLKWWDSTRCIATDIFN